MNACNSVIVCGEGWRTVGRILQGNDTQIQLEYQPPGGQILRGWFHGPDGLKPGRRFGDSGDAAHTFKFEGEA